MARKERIEERLQAQLQAQHLEVVNESHLHSVAPGSETHFKVLVVAPAFAGLKLMERHRLVHGALTEELQRGLHALSLKTLSPAEWEAAGGKVHHESPQCRGGSKAQQ